MEKLPLELLSKIMLYLPLVDRLSCSLTCRRCAEAMTSSRLLHDVWLDIAKHEMRAASSVLVNSRRQYTKLLLYKAHLSVWDFEFWEKIGANLRVLELHGCSWSNHLWCSSMVFYGVLQRCPMLESLKIEDGESKGFSIDHFVPPEGACREELRDALSHLQHLHLSIILTTEFLDLLLGLMPNVTSIFLSLWFHKGYNLPDRLSSVLKANGINRIGLSFHHTEIDRWIEMNGEEFIKFVGIASGSLEGLHIDSYQNEESAYDAIVNCTKLRRLSLKAQPGSFRASHLEKLVSNSPDLEILELYESEDLQNEDMACLFTLKKLRTLSFRGYTGPRITTELLCRLGEMSTLVELNLTRLNVNSRVMQSLKRLTNLRVLVLDECADSECFEAICENFKRLIELDLGWVKNLTEADGFKLCRFKELRSLSFCRGCKFSDSTFKRGVGSRAMRFLRIHGSSLTDAGLASIASHHDRLERLELYHCKNITCAGVLALLHKEPRLKEFFVSCCRKVRFEDIASQKFCPRLRDLRCDGGKVRL